MQEQELLDLLESVIYSGDSNHTEWPLVQQQVEREAQAQRRQWKGLPRPERVKALLERHAGAYRWR